jgi:hypothetical protein
VRRRLKRFSAQRRELGPAYAVVNLGREAVDRLLEVISAVTWEPRG